MKRDLFVEVRQCLRACEVEEKLQQTREVVRLFGRGDLISTTFGEPLCTGAAGFPVLPKLVKPGKVPRRGFGTAEGRAVMMHAIAHIEFNAINLALDAVQRFPDMPDAYYADWLQVAAEEAYHFELIRAHLRHLGAEYGDFDAHAGLWDMAEKTAYDVLVRMALVPRVLEARGLDVTPGIQEKLRQAGDKNAASILDVILRDEVGHVQIGNRWFHFLCKQRGLAPEKTFAALLSEHYPKGLFGPFNLDARRQAGFSEAEFALLSMDGCG